MKEEAKNDNTTDNTNGKENTGAGNKTWFENLFSNISLDSPMFKNLLSNPLVIIAGIIAYLYFQNTTKKMRDEMQKENQKLKDELEQTAKKLKKEKKKRKKMKGGLNGQEQETPKTEPPDKAKTVPPDKPKTQEYAGTILD